jgi:subtilisin family serine protease
VVQGVDAQGNPITDKTDVGNGNSYEGGTSAATPQVSAAAALLLSLNPDLSAAEIKQILSDTARPGPAEVGGKILAVDQAVLKVINQQRDSMGLPAVTGEELEKAA